jgi:hypothetical protein
LRPNDAKNLNERLLVVIEADLGVELARALVSRSGWDCPDKPLDRNFASGLKGRFEAKRNRYETARTFHNIYYANR